MLPVISNQTEMMLVNGYKSITVLGPRPGAWYSMITADQDCPGHRLTVAARAEYRVATDLINLLASYHNYQELRTLVTVPAGGRRTFRFAVPASAWSAQVTTGQCGVGSATQSLQCPVTLSFSSLSLPTIAR